VAGVVAEYEAFAFSEYAIYGDTEGYSFGCLTFDRDVRTADWSALERMGSELTQLQEIQSKEGWCILNRSVTLITDPASGFPMMRYDAGTPLRRVEDAGAQPGWTKVDVFGTEGWVEEDCLQESDVYLLWGQEDEPDAWQFRREVYGDFPLTVRKTPEGDVVHVIDGFYGCYVLGEGNGWRHVFVDGGDLLAGYVPADDISATPLE